MHRDLHLTLLQPLPVSGPLPAALRLLTVKPLPSVPDVHRDDPVWLSLFDRAITGVLAFVTAFLIDGAPTLSPELTPETSLALQVCLFGELILDICNMAS